MRISGLSCGKEQEKEKESILLYGDRNADTVLIQMINEQEAETLQEEIGCINDRSGVPGFLFCACKVKDWNRDLSPWEAPPAFGKEGFVGGAEETLAYLEDKVIPDLSGGKAGKKIIIGGYSLSGLFALWAACRTDLFSGVAAASPSVWFPGFADYVRRHPIKTTAVYLSLGDKEENAKNRMLASVGDAIRDIAAHYAEIPEVVSILEWNEGNHFKDVALRTGRAFAWTLQIVSTLA